MLNAEITVGSKYYHEHLHRGVLIRQQLRDVSSGELGDRFMTKCGFVINCKHLHLGLNAYLKARKDENEEKNNRSEDLHAQATAGVIIGLAVATIVYGTIYLIIR